MLMKYDVLLNDVKPINQAIIKCAIAQFESLCSMQGRTIQRTIQTFAKYRKHNPILTQIVEDLVNGATMFTTSSDFARVYKISRRVAQKYLKRLCELRWLAKELFPPYGHNLNPFYELMIQIEPRYKCLTKFAMYQIDLLDLLTLPLFNGLNEKVENAEIIWSQHEPKHGHECFPTNSVRIYPYWNGILQIEIKTHGFPLCCVLPYNIHWTGRNAHITLPIKWAFYGIKEVTFTKDKVKVHFDESTTVAIPLESASWSTRKELHEAKRKHWSDSTDRFLHKYWENQYVEAWDFQNHVKLLRMRLINKTLPLTELHNKHEFAIRDNLIRKP